MRRESIKLRAKVYNQATESFQWQKNDVDIIGATDSTYQATDYGSYRVKKTYYTGCEVYSAYVDVMPVTIVIKGLKNSPKKDAIKV